MRAHQRRHHLLRIRECRHRLRRWLWRPRLHWLLRGLLYLHAPSLASLLPCPALPCLNGRPLRDGHRLSGARGAHTAHTAHPPPDATMEGRAVEVACGICGRRGDVEGTVGTVVDTNTPPMINCGGATPAVVAT